MDTAYKIHVEILRKRVEKEMQEKNTAGGTQTGYIEERGTIDAKYMVKTAIEEETKNEGGEVFIFFIDMIRAFEKRNRGKLWKIMEEEEIAKNLRKRIENLCDETGIKIRIKEQIIGNVYTKVEVR